MPKRDIIVIGTSADGVEALRSLVRLLPQDFPAAVFTVVHFPPHGVSHLPKLLARSSRLPVAHAIHGESIQFGRLYVAPQDHHLLVLPGHVELSRGPTENRTRPAIDVLFRSAAQAYGNRVVAVVLSGAVSDTASGLIEVKKQGGVAIVQDLEEGEAEAISPGALQKRVQHILPLAEIAAQLERFARDVVSEEGETPVPDTKQQEQEKIDQDLAAQARGERQNQPATYTCPECGGNLWEVDNEGITSFQCHVGHTLSSESLLVGKTEEQERFMWAALRSAKERAALLRQMATKARQQNSPSASANFEKRLAERMEAKAQAAEEDARQLQAFLERLETDDTTDPPDMPS